MGPVQASPGLAFKTLSSPHAPTTASRTSTTAVEVQIRRHVASLALTAWVLMVAPLLRNSAVLLENQIGAV
jgi:hypothetical protein